MNPLLVNLIGVAAAVCSMLSFVPQVIKIWREKHAGSVSLRMYVVTVTGFGLWTLYGLAQGAWPLVGSNLVCLSLAAVILALKLRYGDGEGGQEKGPPDRSGGPISDRARSISSCSTWRIPPGAGGASGA